MMCTNNPGKDTCYGDDGGPLFDATENVLVGIVSNYRCGGGLPSVFSRIADQWGWIQTTICADHSNPKPDLCPSPPTTGQIPTPVTKPTATPVSNPARPPMKPKKPAHQKKGGKGGKGGNGAKGGKTGKGGKGGTLL